MRTADRVRLDAGVEWPVASPAPLAAGARVRVVVRPEALRFAEQGLPGTVLERRYTGARAYFVVRAGDATLEVEAPVHAARVGEAVRVVAERAHAFPEVA
jgi:hypothetical protein